MFFFLERVGSDSFAHKYAKIAFELVCHFSPRTFMGGFFSCTRAVVKVGGRSRRKGVVVAFFSPFSAMNISSD